MAAVNSFTSVVQGVPKQALEWTLSNSQIQGQDVREEAASTKEGLLYGFKNEMMDLTNQETSRGSQRSGWAGVRADRLRHTKDYNAANVDRLMNRQLSQLARNRKLATLGYTL